MNFITFGTAFTNIFPAANSKNGGQLATEFNLRSRESVGTHSAIEYEVGPSYVHSLNDYKVRVESDDSGAPVSYSVLEVMPGRGVINGHYVETLQSMTVDLLEANATLKSQARPPLKGKLAVGIRAFYATEQTIAGSLLVENAHDMYAGMQLVVLPEDELITPIDSPADRSKVTAHIKLATFTFNNNRISNIVNNEVKCQYISAERIANIDMMLSDEYVKKTGLNSKKLYAFAGKGTDPATGYDTWEDVTDSMIVWDNTPQRTTDAPLYSQAVFAPIGNKVYLVAPHKQVDGMTDAEGHPEYYAPRAIELPTASFGGNTPGVVDKTYTLAIKEISEKVEEFRTTLNGKQILYLAEKDSDTVLPSINPAWNNGDYILVGQDFTADEAADGVRAPATLYVVLPGYISEIEFTAKVDDSEVPPVSLTGACLGKLTYNAEEGDPEPSTSDDPTTYPVFFTSEDPLRGDPNGDYFVALYINGDNYSMYYYRVKVSGPRAYSSYVMLTGEIPLAQEDTIGGFLNVSTDYTDYGYVYRDEYGRLRLLDYQLLRSGVLAYQLGEDITLPTGLSATEVQTYLDEYVNQRVAFPRSSAPLLSDVPNMVNLYIYLTAEDSEQVINICDIDSRFNTGVYIHILGDATSTTTVNIYDCEKVRIDNTISGSPIINVYRSCLYYDPYVMNYIRSCIRSDDFTGFQDIKLWYAQFDEYDPKLVVDNMTVSEIDAPVIPEDIDYWNVTEPNDNHYLTALHSITFDGSGDIVGCGLLVANNSTDNVDPGEKIVVGSFTLPQGSALSYPKSCMTHQLKVTGTFVSAYYADSMWYTTNTSFSAITSVNDPYDTSEVIPGNIAFHSVTTLVSADIGATSIPVWETDTFHIFYGGAV